MIKLITFDLDNTLWEVMPAIVRAEQQMSDWLNERVANYSDVATTDFFTELRARAIAKDPQLVYNISDMRVQLLTQALVHCGLEQRAARPLADGAFEVFMRGRNDVELFPDAWPTLKKLAKNYRLAALTNGNADISTMPIADLFEFSVSPEKVQSRKPEPAIFAATLAQAGCAAHEVVHVGDHLLEDVGGAVDSGWYAIWVNLTDEPEPETARYSASVKRLSDLPGAISRLA